MPKKQPKKTIKTEGIKVSSPEVDTLGNLEYPGFAGTIAEFAYWVTTVEDRILALENIIKKGKT